MGCACCELAGVPAPDPTDPEAELAALFADEAALKAKLADVRRALDSARLRYGALHGLQVLPSFDGLRRRLAPQVKP